MNKYIGHESQLYGVEECRLYGGKGDGMRLLNVRNGMGLELTISLDRAADISRLCFKGDNFGYFAPCGYVSPKYYDPDGAGFLKSFTAGFLTTCGLTTVGNPCTDEGESLPLHGTISNIPSENHSYYIEDGEIHIKAQTRDAALFANQLLLTREYVIPLCDNKIHITDTVENIGSRISPFMMLYHFNIGYPLLSENTEISIPSGSVLPRNEHAKSGIGEWNIPEKPQNGYEEMCFYHKLNGKPTVGIKNHSIKKALEMSFDTNELDFFTEWKMMGEYEYVLGLEPGNCNPDGRDVMRKSNSLKFLEPGEKKQHHITLSISQIL